MLELILIAIATLCLANRKPTPRRRYSLRQVRITPEIVLSTLASATAIVSVLTAASTSQYRAISVKATWTIRALTGNEGPVTVGYAHSDYTVVEIKEALEASLSISPGDKVAQERTNRLVRIVGTFGDADQAVLNDGRPIKTRLNWLITIGQSVNMFAFNDSGSALTTGSSVHLFGSLYVKDAS